MTDVIWQEPDGVAYKAWRMPDGTYWAGGLVGQTLQEVRDQWMEPVGILGVQWHRRLINLYPRWGKGLTTQVGPSGVPVGWHYYLKASGYQAYLCHGWITDESFGYWMGGVAYPTPEEAIWRHYQGLAREHEQSLQALLQFRATGFRL